MRTCPILPEKKISSCLIGAKYIDEINDLTELGVECITMPSSDSLFEEINSHADIQCFNCGNREIIINERIAGELEEKLKDYTIIPCNNIKSPYPDDVKLNAALIGNNLICNENLVADEIKSFCHKNGITIIHTKQGYAKCSLCVVNEKAVITEDDGLTSLLKNYQFDVLKIKPGFIHLSDKHYGFIGGASGIVSKSQMYFSGDLSRHPNYEEILSFLNKYNIKPVFNKNRQLNDFGGFIPLKF